MDSSIGDMETKHSLICIIFTAIVTLKAGVSAAPTVTEECDVPMHLKDTDCCTSNSEAYIKEPVVDQKCVTGLIDSEVSSYEKLESALECFFECLLTNIDFLDKENKIDYEEVFANMTEGLNPELVKLPISRIRNCVEKDYVVKESSKCKSGSLQLFLCVHREKVLNCPADNWRNSEECNNYKSVLEKCPKKTPLFQLLTPETK